MEGVTKTGAAAMCDRPQMLHDYARVLAHEWPDACPHEVAIRLWNGLSQPARDAEILDSIACAYEAWGPFLEAKNGRLPRATDGCDGVKEFVRDLAEAEAQRKLALTVMLERDGEFLKAPTWGFTVQSWAIGAGIRSTVDELFAVDTSVKSTATAADSEDVTADVKRPPYLVWISQRKASAAEFTSWEDPTVFEMKFGTAASVTVYTNDDDDVILNCSQSARPYLVDEEHRAELAQVIHEAAAKLDYDRSWLATELLQLPPEDQRAAWGYEPLDQWFNAETGEIREYTATTAAHAGLDLAEWKNETQGLWWMNRQEAYETLIAFTLKYDSLYEETPDPLPADEIADHILLMFAGSPLLERVLYALPSLEPDTRAVVSMERNYEVKDWHKDTRDISHGKLREYLARYVQLEREEPTESFKVQDCKALARRVPQGLKFVARYAREVAKDSDMSSQALADYFVGECLDEEQRKQLLGGDVDNCWHLANLLALEIRAERGEGRKYDDAEACAS